MNKQVKTKRFESIRGTMPKRNRPTGYKPASKLQAWKDQAQLDAARKAADEAAQAGLQAELASMPDDLVRVLRKLGIEVK